jgi:hypothetical protein
VICSICGSARVEWKGDLANLTHTQCDHCGAINSQEYEELSNAEDGEDDAADDCAAPAKIAFKETSMLSYSTPEEEFSHAAYLLGQVRDTLEGIVQKDPTIWARFHARMVAAGVDYIGVIADECDLVSLLISQDAGTVLGGLFTAEMVQ